MTREELISVRSTVDPQTGCWNWNKPYLGGGHLHEYGSITHNKKAWRAHRFSYTVFKGEIPAGLFVCHKCDNPRCVNPDHLFIGTRQDNVDDRERKGRNKPQYGPKNPKTKLSIEKAIIIRERYALGKTTLRQLGTEYGVNKSTIRDIIIGKNWVRIEPPKAE